MPSKLSDRQYLEKRLGDFLGFDDADESLKDILDHLLSIDSPDDLREYVVQLLGASDDDIKQFCQDIGSFQQGKPLEGNTGFESEESKEKGKEKAATVHQPQPALEKSEPKTPAQRNPPKEKNQGKKPEVAANSSTKAAPQKASTGAKSQHNQKVASQSPDTKQPTKTEPNEEVPKKKYGLPPKGKARHNCGCYGTLHKPLTNCLYCGRISCEEEGYDFCNFCGYLVEEVKAPDREGGPNSAQAKAWRHKERLLRYDRDSAKRTVVLDDQADYYSNQTSTWLTEEEQADAEDFDHEQRTNLHQRKKQTLNIAF